MKVLIDHSTPFMFAHGGFQTQIEQTRAALERRGLEVEYLRWWGDRQTGDLLHYFGAPGSSYLNAFRERRMPIVLTHLFTATCNRSPLQLAVQGMVTRTLMALPGWGTIKDQLQWKSFRTVDRMIVGIEAERRVLRTVYSVPQERITTVPLGLPEAFLKAGPGSRSEPYLISTGTITDRKRSIELALMARELKLPILFVGKPYSPRDPYWEKFSQLIDQKYVLHRGHVDSVDEMIRLLQSSRGFVLFSRFENWCFSAHEAAACGLPVLLPDLPWSRERFGGQASYLDASDTIRNLDKLRAFYEKCPTLPAPSIKLYSWDDAATTLEACYSDVLKHRN